MLLFLPGFLNSLASLWGLTALQGQREQVNNELLFFCGIENRNNIDSQYRLFQYLAENSRFPFFKYRSVICWFILVTEACYSLNSLLNFHLVLQGTVKTLLMFNKLFHHSLNCKLVSSYNLSLYFTLFSLFIFPLSSLYFFPSFMKENTKATQLLWNVLAFVCSEPMISI